ncbi:hypothetical protein [Vibrio splendidus]|uniref:hypothetical protein n=1 Tax=Vibrio splendidus TaxID=29497 RepID=UPI002468CA8F|nr:hypothetical protein [Vibrio splendidus]MDH5918890.1 hypothetical protein [Vibrio splendidus]
MYGPVINKTIGITIISLTMLGCSDDSESEPIELSEQFQGVYINQNSGDINSAVLANSDHGEFLLIDFLSDIAFAPSPFLQSTNSIDYSQYKEGALGSWTLQTGDYHVDFSENTAVSDQLGVELDKSISEPLANIDPSWNLMGSKFKFTAGNSITYEGYLEFDDDGYWELDDDLPFIDSSGQMVASNAEVIVFIKSGKTYSIIYDKKMNSVVSIDVL